MNSYSRRNAAGSDIGFINPVTVTTVRKGEAVDAGRIERDSGKDGPTSVPDFARLAKHAETSPDHAVLAMTRRRSERWSGRGGSGNGKDSGHAHLPQEACGTAREDDAGQDTRTLEGQQTTAAVGGLGVNLRVGRVRPAFVHAALGPTRSV